MVSPNGFSQYDSFSRSDMQWNCFDKFQAVSTGALSLASISVIGISARYHIGATLAFFPAYSPQCIAAREGPTPQGE